nr:MAG TPA: DNA-directed RNA polymerase [Caudoviricetes sp.]
MRLEFKDANKEVNVETQAIGTEDIKHVLQVLKLLLQDNKAKQIPISGTPSDSKPMKNVQVEEKLLAELKSKEATRTPKPVDNDKMVKSKVYPSLCYVECNRLSTCADAGTDKCQKYAWVNRREHNTVKFKCGHSMNISDFPLDIAEYTCGCCNAHYVISCSVDGEHFTVNCGKCEAPIDLKWNARREMFDNL